MQYRKFGSLEWEVSALGFGTMRLPLANGDMSNVDEPQAISMIRYAIDHGVNYVDTAYPYHHGQGERIVGRALKDGYRQRIKLTTKLPLWDIKSADEFDRYISEQLERLQLNKVDFYLLHGLNKGLWYKVRDLQVLRWAEGAIAKGYFDYLGFSFHDDFDVFKEIVDAYDNWTLSQIQYNYMGVNNQAGRQGLEYAASKGLAVVVMGPVRGGMLSRKPPEPVAKALESAPRKRSQAEWALQWVWNHPEVSVALSGMSTMEQVVENVASAERSGPGTLTVDELAFIERLQEAYNSLAAIPCTNCGYCLPCPSGVAIPTIFQIYNEFLIYSDPRIRSRYASPMGLKEDERGDQCIECEDCLEICPQDIPITEWLKKLHPLLIQGNGPDNLR